MLSTAACADLPPNPCDQPLRDLNHPSIKLEGGQHAVAKVDHPLTLRVIPQTTGDLGCVWYAWDFKVFPNQAAAITRAPEATVRYAQPGEYRVQVRAYTTRGPTAHTVIPVRIER
jgi:hypothetical protein